MQICRFGIKIKFTTFNDFFIKMIYVGSNTEAFTCKHGHRGPEVYSIMHWVEV